MIEKDGVAYTVGHTHFVGTHLGEPNEQQVTAMERLLKHADTIPDFVLCGYFNAPRGKAVWEMLAKEFMDNIPPHETTTLDQVLNQAAPLHYVVDGMFTKGRYTARDVSVISGASDHRLITALINVS
jgi:endonuclease/exonuclease/phosphatase family metal-dependent hydrolase